MFDTSIAYPPAGSAISVSSDRGDTLVSIPQPSAGVLRFAIGGFLAFWLCGWVFGFVTAISALFSGKANAFVAFWLGGWTIGGGFAIYFLIRIFRPAVPETLRLHSDSVTYDSGFPPFIMHFGLRSDLQSLRSVFPKRSRVTLNRDQLRTLALRATDSGSRLTVDAGTRRIDMAIGVGEIEREWLFNMLARRYQLEF